MTGATGPGPGATGPTGASATGATGATGSTGATGIPDSRFKVLKVPEKYANEPWAKEVKSVDDLWSKMAGAQKLLGKDKITLPGDNATDEELQAFYTRMGRPEKPEGYEFKSITELQEIERNVDLDTGLKKIFFNEGISKKAGERIVAKYEELVYDMQKPAIDAAAKRDVDFQKLADEVLGADRTSSMEAFKTVMREALGEKGHLVSKIEGMDNEVLLPLIVLGKHIHDKYTGENRVQARPGQPAALSGDLKTDFQSLSSQKLAIKLDVNMPEHVKKLKLATINGQIQKIGAAASEKGIDLFK